MVGYWDDKTSHSLQNRTIHQGQSLYACKNAINHLAYHWHLNSQPWHGKNEFNSSLLIFLLTVPWRRFFSGSVFVSYLCHTVMSVSCSLVVACWERAGLLALLFVMFSCVIVTFPFDVLGQLWYTYLMVSIPIRCRLPYFVPSLCCA